MKLLHRFFGPHHHRNAIHNLEYLQSLLSGRPFPVWAYILLTRKCNLTCSYCYVTEDKLKEMGLSTPKKEMDLSELKYTVDKLASMGTRWISFFGGEPTLRKRELLKVIEYASKSKQIFTQLPTNAFLLKDETYVENLGQAGIGLIDVSLDSVARFDASKKDLYHREEVFETLFRGRERHRYGIKTNLVLTKGNLDQLTPVMDFADRHNIIISIRLAFRPPIKPTGWKEETDVFFSSDPEDVKMVDDAANTILQRKADGIVTTEPNEYYHAMKRHVRGEAGIWKCDAGKHHLTIDSDGAIMQCSVLLDGLGTTVFELDKRYFEKLENAIEDNLRKCNDNCLAAAYFCSRHYRNNPTSIFAQGFLEKL